MTSATITWNARSTFHAEPRHCRDHTLSVIVWTRPTDIADKSPVVGRGAALRTGVLNLWISDLSPAAASECAQPLQQRNQRLARGRSLDGVIEHDLACADGFAIKALVGVRVRLQTGAVQ
jgi:hypothetical protein